SWPVSVLLLAIPVALVHGFISAGVQDSGVSYASEVDAVQAWGDAVAESVARLQIHGVRGTLALLDNVLDLPVKLAGWELLDVECVPEGNQWRCQARYLRKAGADNQGFADASPSSWQIAFDPLEGVTATWRT